MADEVQGSIAGPNGERVKLTLGTRSIGLQVRDLLPILLLVAGVVGGYLLYQSVARGQERLFRQQEQMQAVQHQAIATVIEIMHKAGDELRQLMLDHAAQMDKQRDDIKRLFAVWQYNQDKPADQQLPLELAPPR
jgi:hypothetical protein